jgi:glycosyltransferase involved in cell wall biosynthesis
MRIIHLANRHHDVPSAGHGFWLNREYKDSCVRQDAEFLLVAPKVSVDPESYPLFALDRHSRGRLTYFPLLGLKADFNRLRLLLQDGPKDSILHVYEGGLREFLLVVRLASEFTDLKSVFNFNLSDPWQTAVRSKNWMVKHIWKHINALVAHCNKSVVFTAETKELALLLGTRLIFPLREYALPPNVPFELIVRKIEKDWDFFIPVFGEGELSIVMDALHELKRRTGKAHSARIQPRWSESLSPISLSRFDELSLELLPKVISQEEYVNTLSASSVVVLPYKNLEYYRLQSSGRVQDAVSLGARVIVPATTSLARQVLERSWGYEFDSGSFLSLADAMEKSLREKSEVQSQFRVVSPFDSIVSQANLAGSLPGVSHWSGSQEKGIKVRLLAASLLFLLSDFRSLVAGIMGLLGVSQNIQARLANALPRKQR